MADLTVTGPFTRGQADRAGLTWRELRGPRYRRLFRGVYVAASVPPTLEVLLAGARLIAGEDAAGSHQTAAQIWGGIVPRSSETHLTVPPGRPRQRTQGLRVYAAQRSLVRRGCGLVTDPATTFVDLGHALDLVDLVVLGDSLVAAGAITADELQRRATTARSRGAPAARRASAYVRGGVDSAMETRSRMLVVLAGLPEPEVNHCLRDRSGLVRRRLDLSYPAYRLAIEYDGRHHAQDSAQWRSDVRRREELDALGWRLLVLLAGDVYTTPERTLSRICAAMASRGMRVPVLDDAWRRHFGAP